MWISFAAKVKARKRRRLNSGKTCWDDVICAAPRTQRSAAFRFCLQSRGPYGRSESVGPRLLRSATSFRTAVRDTRENGENLMGLLYRQGFA